MSIFDFATSKFIFSRSNTTQLNLDCKPQSKDKLMIFLIFSLSFYASIFKLPNKVINHYV